MHGGANRCRRNILGGPWNKYRGNPGGGKGVIMSGSRGQGGRQQGQSSGYSDIWMQRRATPRWAEDPVWRMEML